MLDPEQQARARLRVREHEQEADYHREQAENARAKAVLLARTWQLCPFGVPLEPECCGNLQRCDDVHAE